MIDLSIIIPTYNRRPWLDELLDSIAAQDLPADRFEVLVVDDGSTDTTAGVAERRFPFHLRYFHQANSGDAAARNLGARQTGAELLLFLDDDILLEPGYVGKVLASHAGGERRIVVGRDLLWLSAHSPLAEPTAALPAGGGSAEAIPFAEVCSNNMSLRRTAYFEIGMMEALDFKGSSMWCDVDFAYRAYQAGYEFIRNGEAVCWHRDYVHKSLDSQVKRMEEVAFRAVALFEKYPALVEHLPMFVDKTPIDWSADGPRRILRKLLRRVSAAGPVLWALERGEAVLGDRSPGRTLRRWIVGAHIMRGYRRGVRNHV